MKSCPYCKQTIEDNLPYCSHCNKPLLVNLNKKSSETQTFDLEIIKEDELQQRIKEIENSIQQKIVFGESIGSLLLEKANLFYQKKDLEAALKNLESALNIFIDDNDLVNIAISYNEIGLIHEETGFYDNAMNQFEQSLEILENTSEYKILIQVYNNLANIHYLLQNIEKSYEYYNKALKLAERENFTLEEIKTSSNLVEILFYLEDYEKIERILKRNLEYFRYINDNYGVIISLSKMGKLYYQLGHDHYDQANQNLLDALDLITKIGYDDIHFKAKLKWECYFYLGKVYLAKNNRELAESYLLDSLETIRILEDKNINECRILETLANLYELSDENTKAIDYYKLSNDIYQKFGNDVKLAEVNYKIAQIYQEIIEKELPGEIQ